MTTGIVLRISNLKDEWYADNIADVFSSLEALIPPRELNIPFQVYFKHVQNPKGYGNVNTAFFNDFDYKVSAKFDAENLMIDFVVERNELDLDLLRNKYGHLYEKLSFPFDLDTIENRTFRYSKSIEKMLHWDINEAKRDSIRDIGSFQMSFNYIKLTKSRKEGYPYKEINSKERKALKRTP